MTDTDRLRTVYSATLQESDGRYVIEVPRKEIESGNVREGTVYRIAFLETTENTDQLTRNRPTAESKADRSVGTRERVQSPPPVSLGETRHVTIEDIGAKGDGVARVDNGYVVIVPDASVGEEVTIKITEARDNVGFGTIIGR